tara:strand:- start:947 stop:1408 length:462 start_codon:yes stop_codon:yes gene_type:complete
LFRDFQNSSSPDYIINNCGAELSPTYTTVYRLPPRKYAIFFELIIPPGNNNSASSILSGEIEKLDGNGTVTVKSTDVKFYKENYTYIQGYSDLWNTIGNDGSSYSGNLWRLKVRSEIEILSDSCSLKFGAYLGSNIFDGTDRIYKGYYKAVQI